MNVSLTPTLETMIQEKVRQGFYNSASEVVREALRLLQERDQERQVRLDALRHEIAVGIQQADAGRLAPLDVGAAKAEARARRRGG